MERNLKKKTWKGWKYYKKRASKCSNEKWNDQIKEIKKKTRKKMKSSLTPKYVVTSKIKDKMSIQSTRCNLRIEVVMRSISKMVKSKRQA